ncbi:MAG: Flp pilus assembly protein CpaB [Rhodospirillales bacterium]
MRVLIVGIIVLALAVAAVSTYLIKTFSTPEAIEQIEAAVEPVRPRVLVATQKLNRGDVIREEHLRWQFWPEEGVNKLYVTVEKDDQEAGPVKEYTGAIIRDEVEAGEPILPSKVFKRGESGVMAGILKQGMRAVAIPVQPDTSAGGFILPGDRVDVLLSHNKAQEALRQRQSNNDQGGGADEPFIVLSMTTETILRNVLVLAIDGVVGQPEGATMQARTATLELTPKQAELMATAQSMGKLSLTLRSIGSEEHEDEPRSFTTDVEVSPFLSNIEAVIQGERQQELTERIKQLESEKRIQEQIAREQANEIQVLSTAVEESGQPVPETPRTVDVTPQESVVKIYRGGKQQVEEVSPDGSSGAEEPAEQ